ncbi:hypothetical protein SAMN04515669_3780 [Jiangella sp. DSM 45060]|nr:hypothetical protein SAMN04515669_3780 [Jiangella sp. DSM 45060]
MFVVDVWTGARAAVLRQIALRMSIEEFAEALGVASRTVSNWEKDPALVPRLEAQRILDTALEQLTPAARERFKIVLAAEGGPSNGTRQDEPDDALSQAERGVRSDAIRLSSRVGSETLEVLTDGIVEIARDYNNRPLVTNFTDLQKLHKQSTYLMEHARRPAELHELFVISSQAMALMGSVAFDLGRWRTAERLITVAKGYAEGAGHRSLEAWSLGLQATIAFWDQRPANALELVEHGLELAPPGTSRTRLRHIAARAHAVAGDKSSATLSLRAAEDDRAAADGHHDLLHDSVGGEFAFDDLRAAACETAVFLALRDGERTEVAASKAAQALEGSSATEARNAIAHGLRIDRAAAWILLGDIGTAEEALGPILDAEREQKVSVAGRLANIRQLLSAHEHQSNKDAQRLGSNVTEWLGEPDGITPES